MNPINPCPRASPDTAVPETSDLYCQGLVERLWSPRKAFQVYNQMTGLQKVLLWKWAQSNARRAGSQ